MKKITALILALSAILSTASCGKNTADDTDRREVIIDEENRIVYKNSAFSESAIDSDNDQYLEEIAEDLTYENQYIKLYRNGDLHRNNIKAIYGNDASILITKDNKAYNYPFEEDNLRVRPDTEITDAYVAGNAVVYESTDGFTYINRIPVKDIKGEILCTFGYPSVHIISYEDGNLYHNLVFETGVLCSEPNEYMYLKDYATNEPIGKIDEIAVREFDGNLYMYAVSEGRTFFRDLYMLSTDFDGVYYFSLYELKKDYTAILDYGYYDNTNSPLYIKSADAKELTYTTSYIGYNEYNIHLPEGYTATDIEQVIFDDVVLVRFKDGNVYTNELIPNIVGTKLHLNEPLTEITKAGHVVKFYKNEDDEIIMLCDDGVIYYYDYDQE